MKKRELFCWVEEGGAQLAALRFNEYEPSVDLINYEFFDLMDADSQYESDLGAALIACWPCFASDVGGFGPLVELHLVWAARKSDGSLWAVATNQILQRLFAKRSLLVLKGFPLEYEGCAPKGSSVQVGLQHRQNAMKRHYRRLLGVSPLPGEWGEMGWMYKAEHGVTAPEIDWQD